MIDDAGRVACSCARFPRAWHFASQAIGLDRVVARLGHYMREWDHGDTRVVDQVIGAYFMVRREVFEQLQGFDERFFVYFEEVDLAMRARTAGWSSVYLAAAQAYHKGGGTSDQIKAHRLFYSWRSRLQFGRKHFPLWERWLLFAVTYVVEPLSRGVHLALSLRFAEIAYVGQAYQMLLRNGPREGSDLDIPKPPAIQPVASNHHECD
jgi:N-acetylglucosaminyl-diphospho-decaprenol L-rhamnosyltransferase